MIQVARIAIAATVTPSVAVVMTMIIVRVTVAICLGSCIGHNRLFLGLVFHVAFNLTHASS
jgi:hypothetical protein